MAQAFSPSKRRGSAVGNPKRAAKPPVLRTTRYDLTSAVVIAVFIAVIMVTLWVTAMWLATRNVKTDSDIQVEMMNLGGYEDGAPDETLNVESPEDPRDDPAVVDTLTEETEVQEMIENVITDSSRTAQQVPQQTNLAQENSGKIGSAEGSGRRPLGSGGGDGNMAKRWSIRLGDRGTLNIYAEQLDFFGIALGVLKDKRITVLSNFKQNQATRVVHNTGAELKNQHYFTWDRRARARRKADVKLFRQKTADKLDASGALIFHFYPQKTIQLLARLEKAAAGSRSVNEIQRTYFIVVKKGNGYDFAVTKIHYK